MKIPPQKLYKDSCAYLKGETRIDPFFDQLREAPVYGIFTEIREKSGPAKEAKYDVLLTYVEVEKYLEHYLMGTLSVKDAQFLKMAVLGSERAFIKIIHKIEMHINAISDIEKNKSIESDIEDEEILKIVIGKGISSVNKANGKISFPRNNAVISAILAVAATLLILFILPIELQQNLDELYNFDSETPLDYQSFNLRGTVIAEKNDHPDYKLFRQQFKKGMSNYVAKDYGLALKEWQKIDAKLPLLRKSHGFTEQEQQLKLYSAFSFLGLALSQKIEISKLEKDQSLLKALHLFRDMGSQNDTTKYYHALALALIDKIDEAQKVLKDINTKSTMYGRKVVLEERLNH